MRMRCCGQGTALEGPCKYRSVRVYEYSRYRWYLCLCLYRYLHRPAALLYVCTHDMLSAGRGPLFGGGRRAQTRHPFLPAAAIRPHWPPEKLAEAEGSETGPPGRYRYPRAAKGTPAGPSTRTGTYRWVPKTVLPTHANALQEPEPRRLQWRSNPARSTVAGAGLPPQQRLRPHGRSTFSLAGKTWRLHQRRCHSVTLGFFFFFFNFFAPARLDSDSRLPPPMLDRGIEH